MKNSFKTLIAIVSFFFCSITSYSAVVYVDIDASSGGDGSSWASAYDDLQTAIYAADDGDELWVAEGTYQDNFVIHVNIKLYGGFDGTESILSQRNVKDHRTELLYFGEYKHIFLFDYIVTIDGFYFDGVSNRAIYKESVSGTEAVVEIANCTFTGTYQSNVITLVLFDEVKIYNCVFHDLSTEDDMQWGHGVIYATGDEMSLVNNTFIQNSVCPTLSLYGDYFEHINISNNIFQDDVEHHLAFHSIPEGLPQDIILNNNALKKSAIVSGSNCQAYDTLLYFLEDGENNFIYEYNDGDFIDGANNDFQLSECSAFINAGSNTETVSNEDFSGNDRIVGGSVDAGAFENQDIIEFIYVDVDATGLNNGTSWTDAYTSIATATENSTCYSEIWVAEGTYYMDGSDFVKFKDFVQIYGGFNGTQFQRDQRDWGLYHTTISGEKGDPNDITDNKSTLISCSSAGNSHVVFDGFTVEDSYGPTSTTSVISAAYAYIELANCKFKNNVNRIASFKRSPTIKNCIFSDNDPDILFSVLGSSIPGDYTTLTIDHSTFANNDVEADIGVNVLIGTGAIDKIEIRNSIFWNNSNGYIGDSFVDSTIIVNNNFDSLSVYSLEYIDTSGNYSYDPMFVNESNQNYNLMECSPLIDLGIENSCTGQYDVNRKDRISNGTTDIGAIEFQYPTNSVVYVDHTATGSNNGSSWSNAYTKLQDAIAVAIQGTQIWVAQGTYYPYDPASPDPTDKFLLECGVSLYGGFLGIETSLTERDAEANETILSGRDANSGNPFTYHILRLKDFTADAVVDGFTIEGGYASLASVTHGAGIWMTNSLGTVNNCKIKNNVAQRGGGIAIINSPKGNIRNCEITNNEAEIDGGGIYVENSSFISRNNILSINLALAGQGGGIFFEDSDAVIKNNRMNNNVALTGGAVIAVNSELYFNYSSFINNGAVLSNNGGVLDLDSDSDVLINNSILHGNEAMNVTNNFSGSTSNLEINNSIVEGGWSGTGSAIIDEDPLLVDYFPTDCSPALDIGTLEDMPNNDITNKSRNQGNGPDLGAYENRNPYYIDGLAGPDKIVCNSTTFDLPYTVQQLDTLYTEWDGSDQVSGVMFDVIFEVPVVLEAVSAHFECSALATNKVYYKQGSYQGSEITSGDWTEIHSSTMSVASNCSQGDTFTMATTPVLFENGKRYGIYVSSARLSSATNYVYTSNEPTAGFGDTLFTDELYTIFHGRGTRDYRFDTPTASSQIFEGGLHISRYDSIQWHKDGMYLATVDTLEVIGGLPPGMFDYAAEVFISNGCSYFDTIQVTAYETITNDDCADAIAIDLTPSDSLDGTSVITSNNLCAGPSGGSGSCNVSSGRDVWYKFFGTESSRLNIVLDNIFPITAKFNPSITVLEGTCGSFTEIACVDDYGDSESETVELTGLDPNTTYYIIVDGANLQMGIYNLTFTDPCLGAYVDYDPIPDKIGSCLNEDILLSSDMEQYDTLATNQYFINGDKFGIYYNIVSAKTVNVHRISSKLSAQSGVHTYQLYTRQGDALSAIDDMSAWDLKGAFTLTDPAEDIYEIPLDIDEVITSADTLGIFLYCSSSPSTGIKVNSGIKTENNLANTNETVNVLYGNSSNGPAFSNNISPLQSWPIGDVIYEEVETLAWYKNGSFISNDYELTVTPVDFDEYILQVVDYDQCQFKDTTLMRTEGKVVQNTNDDGWQSLRSVVACAEWGVDTITFDLSLMGQTIILDKGIAFGAPNSTDNILVVEGFAPNNRMKIKGKNSTVNSLFNIYALNDTKVSVANMDFEKSTVNINNFGDLHLQDITSTGNHFLNKLIINHGFLKLKNNILLQKPIDTSPNSNGHLINEGSAITQIEGNVILIND